MYISFAVGLIANCNIRKSHSVILALFFLYLYYGRFSLFQLRGNFVFAIGYRFVPRSIELGLHSGSRTDPASLSDPGCYYRPSHTLRCCTPVMGRSKAAAIHQNCMQ